jgi:hypothetical protein
MTHELIEQKENEADPRRHPSSGLDDDRGNVEETNDPLNEITRGFGQRIRLRQQR